MADNLSKTEWDAGIEVVSTDVAGAHTPHVKAAFGGTGVSTPVSVTNPLPVGNQANAAAIITNTTPLGIGASYDTATIDSTVYPALTFMCKADVQGTVRVQESTDDTTWENAESYPVYANKVRSESYTINSRYGRVSFLNGSTAQSSFKLQLVPRQFAPHESQKVQIQKGCGYLDTSTTALGIAGSYTAPGHDSHGQGQLLTAWVKADQAGTLYFDASHDNSTWETAILAYPYTSGEMMMKQRSVMAQYGRWRFVNGGVAQGSFKMQCVGRTLSIVDTVKIDQAENVVKGGISEETAPVALDGFDVLPAIADDAARALTSGALARLTVMTGGDLKVTLDSEQVIVIGDVAHGSADAGNPHKIGGKARTTDPTAEANGDRVDAYFDVMGRQVVIANAPRTRRIRNTITLTSTTETTLLAAAASTFHDVTKILVANTSATAVRVDFRDSTTGTVMMSLYASAGQTVGFTDSNDPIEQTTANNNWTAQLSVAVSSVYIFAQAVKKVG